MTENVLIPLPGYVLPADLPWRTGFVQLVNEQVRKLLVVGHFCPPRFLGYYFQGEIPFGVASSWTVSLDAREPISLLSGQINRLTHGRFSIASRTREEFPEYVLVHDRQFGTCCLWSFFDGLRFLESVEPVMNDSGDPQESKPPEDRA